MNRLFYALLLISFSMISCGTNAQKNEIENMTFTTFKSEFLNKTDLQLVDVRTKAEFDNGFIEGAINVDVNEQGFKNKIQELDKSEPVFVYCHAGTRSTQAAVEMKKMGFEKIFNLKEGYIQWE